MFRKFVNLLVIVLVMCIYSSSAISAPAGYSMVWEDTFSGTSLDTANWTIGCRDPGTGDIIPGAAGAYLLNTNYAGYITAEDVWVSNGSLYLQNQKRSYTGTDPAGSYEYTTGWIMSMHKMYFNRGYLEMLAQFPSGDKVWPAYWLIAEDLIWGPEWDVFEYFGYRPDHGYDVMGMNLAYGSYPNINWLTNWIYGYDATYDCEAWHVYGWEWGPDSATWYIDGVEVAHMVNTISSNWPNEDMYIVLNNGVRTDSPDTTTTWPNYMIVDYIELYQSDAVCGNGECEPGEGCSSCPDDCISQSKGNPNNRYCCGDGVCEGAEDETNCAVDCGGGPTPTPTPTPTSTPTPSPTPTGTPGPTLFYDGFESGDFVAGGWTTSGSAEVKGQAAYTGNYGAEQRGVVWIEAAIDTSGHTNIHVKYVCKTKGLDTGQEYLYCDWYDGSSWYQIEATQVGSWTYFDKTCGSGADNNPSFKIRFRLNSNHPQGEWGRLDDVEVTGG